MILCVPNVLSVDELSGIRAELQKASFVDGASTAGWSARGVKKNLQLALGTSGYERLAESVLDAFLRSEILQAGLLPVANTQVLFNRYGQDMHYGPHVDAPVMGGMGSAVRTDIAITVFLSEPRTYDGGELVIYTSGLGSQFKLDAGSVIAYPANTLHNVNPVTRGTRDAAIIWVQSQVRDPARRELLWDLANAKRQIFSREGKTPTFDAISKSHANLLRMWAEL